MYYEIDIIEYSDVEHGAKRGEGADKAQILMILSTDAYNKYPRYMMLHFLPITKPVQLRNSFLIIWFYHLILSYPVTMILPSNGLRTL